MSETATAQRTHYDTLGLAPNASGAAIAEAFGRELRRPHRFGDIATISIAFETLRDPIRREAYDASIGLNRTPPPAPTSGRVRAAFLCPASADPLEKGALGSVRLIEAPTEPEPEPLPETKTQGNWTPKADPVPLTASWLEDEPEMPLPPLDRFATAAPGRSEWPRAGVAIGGLVTGVILLAAWAGWESGNDNAQAHAAVPPPAAKPLTKSNAATDDSSAAGDQAGLDHSEPVITTARHQRRSPPTVTAPQPTADPLAPIPTEPEAPDAVVAGEPPAEDRPTADASAAMKLPGKVVARTLDRIGYSCGQVASTVAVEGGAGVFRVTCSSGKSYLATPVRGRYRFRKAGGR